MATSLKSRMGEKSGPFIEHVPAERIRHFLAAIGVGSEALADSQIEAPATFMTVCRKGEFDLFQKLGVELSRVLHAEQEYTYENQIRANDVLHCEAVLSQVLEKNNASGSLHFLTFVTEVEAQRDSQRLPVGISKTTIVLRTPKQGA